MVRLHIAGETKDQVGGRVDWFAASGVYRRRRSITPSNVEDPVEAYGSGLSFRQPLNSRPGRFPAG